MKNFVFTTIILTFSFMAFAESAGETAFNSNQPAKATQLLEEEIKNSQISQNTYNSLGLSYFQLGNYEKAIDAFERGMKNSISNKKLLSFNEGNVYYARKDYEKAEDCYSLALSASSAMYSAVLNRANARLMQKKYADALPDYKNYVANVLDDPQRPEILRLIAYLEEQIVIDEQEKEQLAEEQKRLEEENAKMQEEIARQEAEAAQKEADKKAAEEERRRKLLEDVANSLQQTESTNMSAGAEKVLEYEYESELD